MFAKTKVSFARWQASTQSQRVSDRSRVRVTGPEWVRSGKLAGIATTTTESE